MPFDVKDFRRALGKFPTGVTVMTALDADGRPVGMTASSFNTLSIDPALVLWSIDKGAWSLDAFAKGQGFAVNVLRSDQVELSNRFARRGEDKFAGIDVEQSEEGLPLLRGTAAHFRCRTWEVYEGGDHYIIVGEVLGYSYEDNIGSLVFNNGRYATAEAHPALKPPGESLAARGLLGDYLLYQLRQTLNAYTAQLYPRLSHFGVTAEEWRVLTLLADHDDIPFDSMATIVGQPPQELGTTVEWLQDRQLVSRTGDQLSLTDGGQRLAQQLLDMAIDHERQMLACLSPQQQADLKQALATLSARLA